MYKPKFSAGLWCYGRCIDRFATGGYGPAVLLEEVVRRAGKTPGITGVEVHYPDNFQDINKLKNLLTENNLVVSCMNVNIFTPPQFKHGAFINRDEKTRREAIDLAKKAVEKAEELNCSSLNLWLGQDGFDYPFQVDYDKSWDLMIDGLREVAQFDPSIMVGVEYKLKEPRTHSTIGGVSKALLAVEKTGLDNVGIVVDFGHALLSKENPAESLCLILKEGKLVNIHFNDAYGDWDDDMIPGVVHLWETVEYLYYLLHSDYQGGLGLDIFPYREDSVEACSMAIQNIQAMLRLAEKINPKELQPAQKTMDAVKTQGVVRKIIF